MTNVVQGGAGEMEAPQPTPDPGKAKFYRKEFAIMAVNLGLNHACVTTPIIYASSVLTNAAGQAGNSVLYASTLLSNLLLSVYLAGTLGSKKGLFVAMSLYSVFVLLFAISASVCSDRNDKGACLDGGPLQMPLYLVGAVIGGVGAGLLWTCQGKLFAYICERTAAAELKNRKDITAELAGTFAAIFLATECLVRVLTTILTKYAGLSYSVVFYGWTGLAVLSAVLFGALATSVGDTETPGSPKDKILKVVGMWNDPKLWLLQFTNLTFGFAVAWNGGYIGRNITTKALSSSFIGFGGAVLSGLASLLSKAFTPLAQRAGNLSVVCLGALAFLGLAVLSKWVGDPAEWGWGCLVFYLMMGVGRAVYESTNKAVFADAFPQEKSAETFSNVFVFGTLASSIAFVLGATGADYVEFWLLLVFAVLTVPCMIAAQRLKELPSNAAGA